MLHEQRCAFYYTRLSEKRIAVCTAHYRENEAFGRSIRRPTC